MIAEVTNQWIDIPSTKTFNGLLVQRCSEAINFCWESPNENGKSKVYIQSIKYKQRELYPNGVVSKEYSKSYQLINLSETDVDESHYMAELNVLDNFIALLGQPNIVNPILQTLANVDILPLDAPDNYPLHLNTRPILER